MYSLKIRHLLMNPINGRKGGCYNGFGECEREVRCRTNPQRFVKNRVKFSVFVVDGFLVDARWAVFGDPVAVATASWCVSELRGRHVTELVHRITPERAVMDLDISNETDIRGGCMAAIQALINALNDYGGSEPLE